MPFSPIDGIETLKRIKDINKDANCVMVTRIYEGDSLTKPRPWERCITLPSRLSLRNWINVLKRSNKSKKNIEAYMANLLPKDEKLFVQIARDHIQVDPVLWNVIYQYIETLLL